MHFLQGCLFLLCSATPDTSEALLELDTVTTWATKPVRRDVDVEKSENIVGRVYDLNTILLMQPSVTAVKEAGSLMLVQGDNYYDNRYYVNGIPVLTLSHFPGQIFPDRSIINMGTDNKIQMETQRISGRYSGASGSVLTVDPLLKTGKGVGGMWRPQALFGYGENGADGSLELPLHKIKNYYELTGRISDASAFLNKDYSSNTNAYIGINPPHSYFDTQLRGVQRSRSVDISEFVVFGSDVYLDSLNINNLLDKKQRASYPFGIATLSIKSSDRDTSWNASVGGSKEYWYEGKKVSNVIPLVTVNQTDAGFAAEINPKIGTENGSHFSVHFHGDISKRDGDLKLTTQYALYNQSGYFITDTNYIEDTLKRKSNGGILGLSTSWKQAANKWFSYGLDGHTGIFVTGTKPFFDPGIWLACNFLHSSVSLSGGCVTSQPDFRGLPSDEYAKQRILTVNCNATSSVQPFQWLNLSLSGFAKYKDLVPVKTDTVSRPIWDESRQTRGNAEGINATIDAALGKYFQLWTSQNLLRSVLKDSAGTHAADWEVPWSNKSALTVKMFDSAILLRVIGTFEDGVRYRKPYLTSGGTLMWGNEQFKGPTYKRIDAKLEIRQGIDRNERNIVRFDAYIMLTNVPRFVMSRVDHYNRSWINVREYSWDDQLRPVPVTLDEGTVTVGLRFAAWL